MPTGIWEKSWVRKAEKNSPVLRAKSRCAGARGKKVGGCTGYPECTATLPDVKGKPGSRSDRSASAQASKPAGACACGGEVRESPKAWQCEKCRAIVWKESFGKRLTKAQALALLSGKTAHLTGLTSRRSGKQYDAEARIEDGKVKLVF